MPDQALVARLDAALAAAQEAGDLTLRHFRSALLSVDAKPDGTPVTVADREAEALLRRRLEAAFPEDAILGEEHGERPGTSGYRWILDPIDGTKSFVRGVPMYATLVGLERHGAPVAGVLHLPATGETIHAARGRGAWHTVGAEPPRPARVSVTADLRDAAFLTTSPGGFRRKGAFDAYRRFVEATSIARGWSDAYGFALVATGRADLMVEPFVSPWDVAAILPILEEAGGRFTDWRGEPTIHGGDAVATNGRLHDATLALLR